MLFVEGIRNVNLSNGVVRFNTVATGPSGEEVETGHIAVPASVYAQLLEQLNEAGEQLEEAQSHFHDDSDATH
jgi:hypothetical protein